MKTRYISISPFTLLAIFYLAINFYYAVIGYIDGYLVVEFHHKDINGSSIIIGYLFQVISIIIISLFYYTFVLISSQKEILYSNKTSFFLLTVQLLYLINNFLFDANIAGSSDVYRGPTILNILFILLQPDLLFLIIAPQIKNKKLFLLNSLVYLISTLLRGWMGGIYLLVLILLIRKTKVMFKFKVIFTLILIAIFTFFISPFIIEAKWVIRNNDNLSTLVSNVIDYGYFKYLASAFDYIFNRFQHIGHIALLIENSEYFVGQYESGYIAPYWGEGLPQKILFRLIGYQPELPLQEISTLHLFGTTLETNWSINLGMLSWLAILNLSSISYLVYLFLIIGIPFFFVSKYGNYKLLSTLSIMALIYLFHGWLYAYINIAFYTIVIVSINRAKI